MGSLWHTLADFISLLRLSFFLKKKLEAIAISLFCHKHCSITVVGEHWSGGREEFSNSILASISLCLRHSLSPHWSPPGRSYTLPLSRVRSFLRLSSSIYEMYILSPFPFPLSQLPPLTPWHTSTGCFRIVLWISQIPDRAWLSIEYGIITRWMTLRMISV